MTISRCLKFSPYFSLFVAFLIFSFAAVNVLPACPFCLSPPMTLAKEISVSDIALIAELLKFEVVRSGEREVPVSTVRIREFLQGSDIAEKCGRLQPGQAVVVRQEITGSPGDLFLLFGSLPTNSISTEMTYAAQTDDSQEITEKKRAIVTADLKTTGNPPNKIQKTSFVTPELIQWGFTPVSLDAVRYIKAAPSQSLPQGQRLPFYISFLENPDPLMSIDAWAEFANSTYDDVKGVKGQFPREKLRQWIADPMMSPERLGLYGMMLGLCGDAADAEFLKLQIGLVPPKGKDDEKFFRYGTDGLMGGYLLLTGESGVEFLEQTRLQPDVPVESVHAALQAVQFLWSYENSLVPPSRLKLFMRRLLSNDELRIVTITNLARWSDWDILPELMQLFQNERLADRATRRAIVQFAEECRKARNADGSPLEIASVASNFLVDAERDHPELFRTVNNAEFIAP